MLLNRRLPLAMLTFVSMGCYTLHPVERSAPVTGEDLSFEVNDAGRVALGTAIGPEVDRVQGRLVEKRNEDYVVAVQEVHTLRGATQVWKGEQVTLKPDYFRSISQRQFSKARTYTLAALVVAAGVFISTRSLSGGGSEDPVVGPPGGSAVRIP